jgi:SEC-C motif-containing protein
MLCPCGTTQSYDACCEPFHTGKNKPATAEQLMRSRYSAYALVKAHYLYATHHPDKRPNSVAEIQTWAESCTFEKLEVLGRSLGGPTDKIGKVEFRAHYRESGEMHVMQEHSRFRRYRGQWVYYDGTFAD